MGATTFPATVPHKVTDKGGFALNARSYGALYDGSVHPLSALYPDLAAAQAAFPLTHAYLSANNGGAGNWTLAALALSDQLDWAGTQEAFLAAAQVYKCGVLLPPGVAQINRTLFIGGPHFGPGDTQGVAGVHVEGAGGQYMSLSHPGTTWEWNGDATSSLLKLSDAMNPWLQSFSIRASVAAPLKYGIWAENGAPGAVDGAGGTAGLVTALEGTAVDVNMTGVTLGIEYGWYIPNQLTHDDVLDANNDFWTWVRCTVTNFKTIAWFLGHSQSKCNLFINCHGRANSNGWARAIVSAGMDYVQGATPETGTVSYFGGGSFVWTGGGGGGIGVSGSNVMGVADFVIGTGTTDLCSVNDADFESSTRFLYVNGLTGNPIPFKMDTVRWAHAGRGAADGLFIYDLGCGPVTLIGNRIENPSTTIGMRVHMGGLGTLMRVTATFIGNYLESADTQKILVAPNGYYQLTQLNNLCKRQSDGLINAYPNIIPSAALNGFNNPQGLTHTSHRTGAYTLNTLVDAGGLLTYDTTAGTAAVTLPTAVGIAMTTFTIRKVVGPTTNPVTFVTTGGNTINGLAASEYALLSNHQEITFRSDGVQWEAWFSGVVPVTNITGALTLAKKHMGDSGGVVIANTAGGTFAITIPAASVNYMGCRVTVKRSGANDVTFAGANVDGAAVAGINLTADNAKVTIACDGAAWWTV